MTQTASSDYVKNRQVFYIPGYDPFPPRRYRELYRKEAQAQAEISGYEISLKGDGAGWRVSAEIDGAQTVAQVDVLQWSDLVQSSMAASIPATYLQLAKTAWIYISTGVLGKLMRLRKGPVIAALYPVGFLLLQLVIAVTAGLIIAGLAPGGVIALLIFFAVSAVILIAFRRYDHKLFAYYLMHDYAFSARLRGAYPPQMETRMAAFRAEIENALTCDVDEVLVVGHSSGAHLAVSILADLVREGADHAPALSLLTLGHVVPMISFLPDAHRLRGDLALLSCCDALSWVDVSAPGDGCCFALCDPVSVTGLACEAKRWPLVISAAFSQTLSPARWQALKRRYFRLHFQYLCAFDRPNDYDYFQITAGPLTLGARYDGRSPSKSRIEQPLSPFTSTGVAR